MEAKSRKLFIDCEEAKLICDKSQYNESTWWDRFRLNIRFIYCNITRAYVKRNQKLTKLVNNKDVNCMDAEKKQELKKVFEKEFEKVLDK